MSRQHRREVQEFGLSFLDVISSGFGAVVLLLIITKSVEPTVIEEQSRELEAVIADLQRELFDIRGRTRTLNRELTERREQLSEIGERVARLQGELDTVESGHETAQAQASETEQTVSRLASAKQSLTEEMERLLGERRVRTDIVGGIPVDSEYIIFVIDTSGSMFNYAWGRMSQKMVEILEVYPEVRGVQIMNDMGEYMFSRYRGEWIPDTPGRRRAIIDRLRTWNPFSNSSPVEGITSAIRTFWSPERKISIYVLGDEFTGPSISQVIDTVDRINRAGADGERRVRIHAVGFPVQFIRPPELQTTGVRFATLMRELTLRNGGTFVGLRDFR